MMRILKEWNIEDEKVVNICNSTWDISDKYILKAYDELDMIERNIQIVSILSTMNIPVSKIINTKDNKKYVTFNNKYYLLTLKVKGENISNVQQNKNLIYELGEIIGHIHLALKECENKITFWDNSLLKEIQGWVKDELIKDNWKLISKEEYSNIAYKLEKVYDELPKQLIHRDMHLGNFLFDEGNFSGYIDFDLSQKNIRIFDICYFLLGIVLDDKDNLLDINDWLLYVNNIIKSYNEYIKITKTEKNSIPIIMCSIELIFIAYFISENNIDYAKNSIKILKYIEKYENDIINIIDI